MLMIVVFHLVTNVIRIQITDADSISRMGNGVFNHPVIYKKLYILYTIMPFGKIGVAIFVLISGYFLVKKGRQINLAKVAKKLFLQLGFATLILVFGFAFLYRHGFSGGQGISLKTVALFNSGWWFVGFYFLLVVIGALFLNKFLNKLSRKKYLTFLLVILAISQFGWLGSMMEDLATGVRVLFTGVFLYALGGYIRKYNPFERIRAWVLPAVIALTYALVYVSCYNNTVQKIENFIQAGASGTFYQSFITYGGYSIVVLVIAIALFEIFRRIKIPDSRVINFIASATFMVYLFHCNSSINSVWNLKDWASLLATNPAQFVLELALWTGGTFLAGVGVYAVYLGVGAVLRKGKKLAVKGGRAP